MTTALNKIIILAAPSGSGKTSITRHLLKVFPDQLTFSISAATRPKRNYENDAVDYYFISVEEFTQKIREEAFVEWELVYEGKYYGTLKSEIQRIWDEGKAALLDVDVKGGVQVQQQFPGKSLSLFIEPPSIHELKRRLKKRGSETPESLASRISKASYEMTFKNKFDRVVLNDDLELACMEAEEIVRNFLAN